MNVLGWLFVPILMLYRKWGSLHLFKKIIGIIWAVVSAIVFWYIFIPLVIIVPIVMWIINKTKAGSEGKKCIYCGNPIGYVKDAHSECQEKNRQGKKAIAELIPTAFSKDEDHKVESIDSNIVQLKDYSNMIELKEQINDISKAHFVSQSEVQQSVLEGWKDSIDIVLADHLLSYSEEDLLSSIIEAYQLNEIGIVESQEYRQVTKAGILRDVKEGKLPDRVEFDENMPFNLLNSEKMIWLFHDVRYFEMKTRREFNDYSHSSTHDWFDDYQSTSSYSQGSIVEKGEQAVEMGKGDLAVTNQHVYYSGDSKSFRVKFDEIVAFDPFKDGIGIQRDSATSHRQIFKFPDKNDAWFSFNLMISLAKLQQASTK